MIVKEWVKEWKNKSDGGWGEIRKVIEYGDRTVRGAWETWGSQAILMAK